MKKLYIPILFTLLLNTIYIFLYGNLDFNDLYNPKLFLYKVKKGIYYELGIWTKNASSSVIFNDKKRIFKKSIKNDKVIVNEITQTELPKYSDKNFINESKENYIIHIFDGKSNQNFIFYNPDDNDFPINLLNLFSLLVVHGELHDNLLFKDKLKTIKSHPLILTCGPASRFFKQLAEMYNIKSRLVSTLTFDEWNSYGNGHTLLEVFSEQMDKWFLYDIDNQKIFKKNGVFLNVVEIQSYSIDDIEIKSISNQPNLDYGSFGKYLPVYEINNRDPYNFYGRGFQKFSIYDEKSARWNFLTNYDKENYKNIRDGDDECDTIKEYKNFVECLDINDFMIKFYSN